MPLAPVRHHIDALADGPGYPAEAVAGCLRQADQATPILRALLLRAARGLPLDDAEASQLFLGVHILACLRDEVSFPILLRLLRRPHDAIEPLLGDALTETLPKVVASLFDGDTDLLLDTLADIGVDQLVRDALWRATAFLTFAGRIATEVTTAFVVRFDEERMAPDRDMAWVGWLETIALLGLEALSPRVAPLWTDRRLPKETVDRKQFETDLAAALATPNDASRFEAVGAGIIEDVETALAWADWDGPPEPYVNPMRDIGRNDPCPCGSGKKAKKCCLAAT